MFRRLFLTIIAVAACIAVSAQGVCVINGTIDKGYLCDGKKVKRVTLACTDEYGREIQVATAKVKKDKYTFKYELAKDEPVLMYTIKGFGEGKDVEVFVEPGEVAVNTYNNAGSIATGTPTNDLYLEFRATCNNDSILPFVKDVLERKHDAEWFATPEGKDALSLIARERIKTKADLMRMLIDNNASPMTPFVIERWLLNLLTPAYADQMLKTIAFSLQNHPYTLSLRNKVLAGDLKVGNELPDIKLPMKGGETRHLTDFRGKYVVLNFWSLNCDKSAAMLNEIQYLYEVVKESGGQVVIISVAVEDDIAAWNNAVENRDGWLHACDGAGTESPALKLLGVDKTPRIVLVEPEGRAVSLDMDMDEVVMRIEQILSGDLYYLDQKD